MKYSFGKCNDILRRENCSQNGLQLHRTTPNFAMQTLILASSRFEILNPTFWVVQERKRSMRLCSSTFPAHRVLFPRILLAFL